MTGWPGRDGQAVVDGSDGSWTSVEPSSSYYIIIKGTEPVRTIKLTADEGQGRMGSEGRWAAYVVIISLAHLETPVLERVASLPLATVSPRVTLHGISFGKVVPGSE